jgi:hypothetical protein
MHDLWQKLGRHPLATSMFAVLWLVTWLVTVLTWERDAAGYSIGMNLIAIPLHLALPLVLGVVVARCWADAPGARAKRCALAGLVFGFVEFGVLWLVDVLWLPALETEPAFLDEAAGALVGATLYAAGCVVLAMLGGALSARLVPDP